MSMAHSTARQSLQNRGVVASIKLFDFVYDQRYAVHKAAYAETQCADVVTRHSSATRTRDLN